MIETISQTATKTAKRLLVLTIIGANVFVLILIAERLHLYFSLQSASARQVVAEQVSASILLADERLTMSARLAAATGDTQWVERYNANIPVMDTALAKASKMASEMAVEDFHAVAVSANNSLIAAEQKAFALIQEGDTLRANALLNSVEYSHQKDRLASATDELIDSIMMQLQEHVIRLEQWTSVFYGLVITCGAVGVLLLWRALNVSLNRSEKAVWEVENRMRDLAMKDPLTGLANRAYFEDRSMAMIEQARRKGHKVALFMLDLDHFKPINDTYGHEMGDNVLKEVSKRLKQILRANDCSARYGGDEFVIMLTVEDGKTPIAEVARRIVSEVSKPMTFDDRVVHVGASGGVAFWPDDASDLSDLLRKADTALYSAKNDGRGIVQLFSEEMNVEASGYQWTHEELRTSIEAGEIIPYFQPIIDVGKGEIAGLELLARWQHPEKGLLSPDKFVEQVIDLNLANEMSLSLLRYGCKSLKAISSDLSLSLNIAAQQIQDEWFVEKLLALFLEEGFPANRLIIELTESALIADFDAARKVLKSCQNQGIRVAIDDFGTGYSSLAYLAQLPFSELKIDQSFVRDMGDGEHGQKIISSIVSLGRGLGANTVAEGVETQRQLDQLTELGCHMVQGYFFSKPVSYEKLADAIRGTDSDGIVLSL